MTENRTVVNLEEIINSIQFRITSEEYKYNGTAIVIPFDDYDMLNYLGGCLLSLYHTCRGCQLNVEVWTRGTDKDLNSKINEVDSSVRMALKYNDETNELHKLYVRHVEGWNKDYPDYLLSVISLSQTTFRHVFLMECNNFVLKNPLSMFETESYKTHGNIFWRDLKYSNPEINNLFLPHGKNTFQNLKIIDPEVIGCRLSVSGLIMIDRQRFLLPIRLTEHLIANNILKGYFWKEKDIYWFSFQHTSNYFNQLTHDPSVLGKVGEMPKFNSIVHHDVNGNPLISQRLVIYDRQNDTDTDQFSLGWDVIYEGFDSIVVNEKDHFFTVINDKGVHVKTTGRWINFINSFLNVQMNKSVLSNKVEVSNDSVSNDSLSETLVDQKEHNDIKMTVQKKDSDSPTSSNGNNEVVDNDKVVDSDEVVGDGNDNELMPETDPEFQVNLIGANQLISKGGEENLQDAENTLNKMERTAMVFNSFCALEMARNHPYLALYYCANGVSREPQNDILKKNLLSIQDHLNKNKQVGSYQEIENLKIENNGLKLYYTNLEFQRGHHQNVIEMSEKWISKKENTDGNKDENVNSQQLTLLLASHASLGNHQQVVDIYKTCNSNSSLFANRSNVKRICERSQFLNDLNESHDELIDNFDSEFNTELCMVTALFDLKRGDNQYFNRSIHEYLHYFRYVLSLRVPMVIYVEPQFEAFVKKHRHDETMNMTKIICMEKEKLPLASHFNEMEKITQKYISNALSNGMVTDSKAVPPEFRDPWYNILMMSKTALVNNVANFNPFNTKYFGWIDAGYMRPWYMINGNERGNCLNYVGKSWPSGSDMSFCEDRITLLQRGRIFGNMNSMEELNRMNNVNIPIVAGIWVGNSDAISKMNDHMLELYRKEIYAGLTDSDGCFYIMDIINNSDLYQTLDSCWFDGLEIFDELSKGKDNIPSFSKLHKGGSIIPVRNVSDASSERMLSTEIAPEKISGKNEKIKMLSPNREKLFSYVPHMNGTAEGSDGKQRTLSLVMNYSHSTIKQLHEDLDCIIGSEKNKQPTEIIVMLSGCEHLKPEDYQNIQDQYEPKFESFLCLTIEKLVDLKRARELSTGITNGELVYFCQCQ